MNMKNFTTITAIIFLATTLSSNSNAQEKQFIQITSGGEKRLSYNHKGKPTEIKSTQVKRKTKNSTVAYQKKLSKNDTDYQNLTQSTSRLKSSYASKTEEVTKTMLYSKTGIKAAREQGRKMWFDPATLQMTVVDTPSNIRKVQNYYSSLPELSRRNRSRVIKLKYANASDMAEKLNKVLGTSKSNNGSASSGEKVIKTLRVEDELIFRDLKLRLVRVEENDANDENDDGAEFVVRTQTDSRDLTIEEFRSEFVDDYEINVLDVKPSSSKPGEGRARVEVIYRPQN